MIISVGNMVSEWKIDSIKVCFEGLGKLSPIVMRIVTTKWKNKTGDKIWKFPVSISIFNPKKLNNKLVQIYVFVISNIFLKKPFDTID